MKLNFSETRLLLCGGSDLAPFLFKAMALTSAFEGEEEASSLFPSSDSFTDLSFMSHEADLCGTSERWLFLILLLGGLHSWLRSRQWKCHFFLWGVGNHLERLSLASCMRDNFCRTLGQNFHYWHFSLSSVDLDDTNTGNRPTVSTCFSDPSTQWAQLQAVRVESDSQLGGL